MDIQYIIMISGGAFLILCLFVIGTHNALVNLRNHISEAWSNIDTELRRRYDLIPNLVNTVKGYAQHERETLESVVRLRQECMSNKGSVAHQEGRERLLADSIKSLFALTENYPVLKADQHFLKLQRQLVNTEDRIQAARRFYNGNVREYKNKCQTFPSNIVAGLFGFKLIDFFNLEPAVRITPDLSISNKS